jgi:hypothetical protein
MILEQLPVRRQHMQSLLAEPFDASDVLAATTGADGFRVRAADSWGARSSASLLVNRLYLQRGYKTNGLPADEDASRMTLVATDHDTVVGTLTVGFDCSEGLLADDLFADEVNALRGAGRQVCEFTKLAMDGLVRSQRVLAALFHVAFIHAHCIGGCDNLLIEVNPRHVRYYQTRLGFQVMGSPRLNQRVNAPAVLLSLDLWHAHDQVSKYGGKPELAAAQRSLYPFGFSADEERGILERLRRQQRRRNKGSACHA